MKINEVHVGQRVRPSAYAREAGMEVTDTHENVIENPVGTVVVVHNPEDARQPWDLMGLIKAFNMMLPVEVEWDGVDYTDDSYFDGHAFFADSHTPEELEEA